MKIKMLMLLICFPFLMKAQADPVEIIKSLNGVWIAEDYYNSFEKTRSALRSKNAFSGMIPAGITINSNAINDSMLTIVTAGLHRHGLSFDGVLNAEKDGGTRWAETTEINIYKREKSIYLKIPYVEYFMMPQEVYMTWYFLPRPTIVLYNTKYNLTTKFIRVKKSFEDNYQYPHPIHYYTRSRNLVGKYTLKDKDGKILSTKFKINSDGNAEGYEGLRDCRVYYSTDVYCGVPNPYDIVVKEDVEDEKNNDWYFFLRPDWKTIKLYTMKMEDNSDYMERDKLVYILERRF